MPPSDRFAGTHAPTQRAAPPGDAGARAGRASRQSQLLLLPDAYGYYFCCHITAESTALDAGPLDQGKHFRFIEQNNARVDFVTRKLSVVCPAEYRS
jgi:hypothetical protein